MLLYYVVLERAIERRGATSVDKTRSFRARNGDSGEEGGGGGGAIDRAETLRASPVCDWKLGWKAFRVGAWNVPDYDFD